VISRRRERASQGDIAAGRTGWAMHILIILIHWKKNQENQNAFWQFYAKPVYDPRQLYKIFKNPRNVLSKNIAQRYAYS
jgi:hypothetical protein